MTAPVFDPTKPAMTRDGRKVDYLRPHGGSKALLSGLLNGCQRTWAPDGTYGATYGSLDLVNIPADPALTPKPSRPMQVGDIALVRMRVCRVEGDRTLISLYGEHHLIMTSDIVSFEPPAPKSGDPVITPDGRIGILKAIDGNAAWVRPADGDGDGLGFTARLAELKREERL